MIVTKGRLLAIPKGLRNGEVLPMGYWTYYPYISFDGIFYLERSPAMRGFSGGDCS